MLSCVYTQNPFSSLRLKQLNGRQKKLASYFEEGPVLINFRATWCSPCKKEMVYLDQFEKKYRKKGFSVVSVSVDSYKSISSVRAYTKSKKFSFDVFLDTNRQLFNQLNAKIMPTNILISSEGKVLWRHYGYMPGDEKNMEYQINLALEKKYNIEDSK